MVRLAVTVLLHRVCWIWPVHVGVHADEDPMRGAIGPDVAAHLGILRVPAVVDAPSGVGTVEEALLRARALHVIEPNLAGVGIIEVCVPASRWRASARHAHGTARDRSTALVPVVVTDCAPRTIVEHLDAAAARISADGHADVVVVAVAAEPAAQAANGHILLVKAVVAANTVEAAVKQRILIAGTGHVVHPNRTRSPLAGPLARAISTAGLMGQPCARIRLSPAHVQTAACHNCIVLVKSIITDRSPLSVVEHLHAATAKRFGFGSDEAVVVGSDRLKLLRGGGTDTWARRSTVCSGHQRLLHRQRLWRRSSLRIAA